MAENIKFNSNVSTKRTYEKIIDTSFKELGVQSIQEQIDEQPNLQKFFKMYNELFYQIPEEGNIQSHQYLIETSAEYIGYENDNDEIQALQNEITTLRQDLLNSQQELINFATNLEAATSEESTGIELDNVSDPTTPEEALTAEKARTLVADAIKKLKFPFS